jgi:hypothetical protein
MTALIVKSLKAIIEANFYISIMVLVVGSGFCISPSYSFFDLNEDLFGAMANNLRLIMLYLAITEVLICTFCLLTKTIQLFIPVGFFLILMIGSIKFYGEINDVEIDEKFPLFFLYTGVSHIVFGAMAEIKKNISNSQKTPNNR